MLSSDFLCGWSRWQTQSPIVVAASTEDLNDLMDDDVKAKLKGQDISLDGIV
jgi:hypothetical protein